MGDIVDNEKIKKRLAWYRQIPPDPATGDVLGDKIHETLCPRLPWSFSARAEEQAGYQTGTLIFENKATKDTSDWSKKIYSVMLKAGGTKNKWGVWDVKITRSSLHAPFKVEKTTHRDNEGLSFEAALKVLKKKDVQYAEAKTKIRQKAFYQTNVTPYQITILDQKVSEKPKHRNLWVEEGRYPAKEFQQNASLEGAEKEVDSLSKAAYFFKKFIVDLNLYHMYVSGNVGAIFSNHKIGEEVDELFDTIQRQQKRIQKLQNNDGDQEALLQSILLGREAVKVRAKELLPYSIYEFFPSEMIVAELEMLQMNTDKIWKTVPTAQHFYLEKTQELEKVVMDLIGQNYVYKPAPPPNPAKPSL